MAMSEFLGVLLVAFWTKLPLEDALMCDEALLGHCRVHASLGGSIVVMTQRGAAQFSLIAYLRYRQID